MCITVSGQENVAYGFDDYLPHDVTRMLLCDWLRHATRNQENV